MSTAIKARQGGQNLVEQSHHVYIDPLPITEGGTGKASGAGTKAEPVLTLTEAKTKLEALESGKGKEGPGKSLGIHRGRTLRATSSFELFGGSEKKFWKSARIGNFGQGTIPNITGGLLVSGWTAVPPLGSVAEGNSATQSLSQHSAYAIPFIAIQSTSVEKIKMHTGTEASTALSVLYALMSDSSGKPGTVLAEGTYVGTPPTNSLIETSIASSSLVKGTKYWLVFSPLGGNIKFKQTTTGTINYRPTEKTVTRISEFVWSTTETHSPLYIAATAASESTVGIFSASLATEPTCLVVTTSGTKIFYGAGAKATSLAAIAEGQWWWEANTLYLWLTGGSSPSGSTVEVATFAPLISINEAPYVTIDGVEFSLAAYHPVQLRSPAAIFKRGSLKYCGFKIGNAGSIEVADASNSRLTTSAAQYCDSTPVYISHISTGGSSGVQVDHWSMSHLGASGTECDGVQTSDTTAFPCNNIWVHDNKISMNASSEKASVNIGTMVAAGETASTGSQLERNVLAGPADSAVLGVGQSQIIIRHEILNGGFHGLYLGQDHNQTEITFANSLIIECVNGITFYGEGHTASRTRTKLLFANFTVTACQNRGISTYNGTFVDELSGLYINGLIWLPESLTEPIIKVQTIKSGEELKFENCIIGPERSGKILIEWLGTGYETLSAFESAHPTVSIGCKSSTSLTYPKLTSITYIPESSSPAFGTGLAVPSLGIVAGSNIGYI